MPLYEYRCPEGHQFEKRQPLRERELAICPQCGALAPKVFSAVNHSFGFRFSDKSLNDVESKGPDEVVRNI